MAIVQTAVGDAETIEDLTAWVGELRTALGDLIDEHAICDTSGHRPALVRARDILAHRESRLEIVADPCPICGGDHDRITREDCPVYVAAQVAL